MGLSKLERLVAELVAIAFASLLLAAMLGIALFCIVE
jgi:hypothetical protein